MSKQARTSYDSSPSGTLPGNSLYNQTLSRAYQSREPGSVRSGGVHPRGPSSVPVIGGTIPIQLNNSQISQPTNNTASVPLLIRPWKDNDHHTYFSGDFMFCQKGASSSLQTVIDLQQFKQMKFISKAELVDHFHQYNFFGIYRNVANIDSLRSVGRTQQALINVDVFGRTNVPNIFGRNTVSGDLVSLYFYCKHSISLDKWVYHIVPINGRTQPQRTNLLEIVPIGIVSFSGKSVVPTMIEKSLESRDTLQQQPQIEVLML
jgi:hypothetical protein